MISRWLAIFLLVLMPLQLSWAAMSAYCQHENGDAALHFGHHEHQHEADTATKAQLVGDVLADIDPDCSTCNAVCLPLFARPTQVDPVMASLPSDPVLRKPRSSPPLERPERPNWHFLA